MLFLGKKKENKEMIKEVKNKKENVYSKHKETQLNEYLPYVWNCIKLSDIVNH